MEHADEPAMYSCVYGLVSIEAKVSNENKVISPMCFSMLHCMFIEGMKDL